MLLLSSDLLGYSVKLIKRESEGTQFACEKVDTLTEFSSLSILYLFCNLRSFLGVVHWTATVIVLVAKFGKVLLLHLRYFSLKVIKFE